MNSNYSTIHVGDSGIKISRLGMGCWAMGGHGWGKVDDKESYTAVQKSLENGVNFFDTSDVYGLGRSEELLSEFLGKKRHSVVIATKGGVRAENGKIIKDCSPVYLRKAVEKSLNRLRIDSIPIFYVHKPDDVTPIKSMMECLVSLKEEGKIQAIGLSNFSSKQILEACNFGPVDIVQAQWNLLYPETNSDIINICKTRKIPFVAWGVLADGLLTGKFSKSTTFTEDDHRSRALHFIGKEYEYNLDCVDRLADYADENGWLLGQVALRWVLDKMENACALFGARNAEQVSQNIGAFHFKITDDLMKKIDLITSKKNNNAIFNDF